MQKLLEYLRATKEEIRKVSWPSRADTIRYSGLVVGISVVVAVFFATLDFGFTKLVDLTITARSAARATQSQPQTTAPPIPITTSTTPTPSVPTLDVKDLQTTPIKVEIPPAPNKN